MTIRWCVFRHLMIALALAGSATIAVAQTSLQERAVPSREDPAASPKTPVTVIPAANDVEISKRLQGILESTTWFVMPRASVRQELCSWTERRGLKTIGVGPATLRKRCRTWWLWSTASRLRPMSARRSGRAGEELTGFYRQAVASWPLVVLSCVILIVTWLIAKSVSLLARHAFASRVASPLLLTVVTRAFSIPIFLLGVYFILQVAGLTRLALTVLGGTGLAGIIIGFAFRDIAENFLASLLLSVRNPFRGGDLVEVAGQTGIVLNLNTRSTILLTLDGSHVQIPKCHRLQEHNQELQ